MKDITCRICGLQFQGHTINMLCSDECRIIARKQVSKRHSSKKQKPAKQKKHCLECNQEFVLKKSDAVYCSDLCRAKQNQKVRADRTARFRKCMKCGVSVPSKPGYPVCADCKIDKRDPVKERRKEELRKFRKYGISEEQYYEMIRSQGSKCAICSTDEPTSKGWQIDHCHSTGKVRGILCHHCNTAIGQFKDNVEHLLSAVEYLRKHSL